MKIGYIELREDVRFAGEAKGSFQAAHGYTLEQDGGAILVLRDGHAIAVPLSNVKYMTLVPSPAKK